jgi:hypothetical protein
MSDPKKFRPRLLRIWLKTWDVFTFDLEHLWNIINPYHPKKTYPQLCWWLVKHYTFERFYSEWLMFKYGNEDGSRISMQRMDKFREACILIQFKLSQKRKK